MYRGRTDLDRHGIHVERLSAELSARRPGQEYEIQNSARFCCTSQSERHQRPVSEMFIFRLRTGWPIWNKSVTFIVISLVGLRDSRKKVEWIISLTRLFSAKHSGRRIGCGEDRGLRSREDSARWPADGRSRIPVSNQMDSTGSSDEERVHHEIRCLEFRHLALRIDYAWVESLSWHVEQWSLASCAERLSNAQGECRALVGVQEERCVCRLFSRTIVMNIIIK